MNMQAIAMQYRPQDCKRVIVGMGNTGLSCARYFAARGLEFALADSREAPALAADFRREFPHVPMRLGAFDGDWLRQADEIVLSPGVDPAEPALRAAALAGARMLGDIELFFREAQAPIVAITGTNAKSTVTTLVGLMAERAGMRVGCGGNLGTPALDLLQVDTELYVLELSSFQLELVVDFRAEVAAFLNFAPDHLDRYRNLADYHRAKLRIYRDARIQVFNRDDPATVPPPTRGARRIGFGLAAPAEGEFGLVTQGGKEHLHYGAEQLMAVEELALSGRHNIANSLAAMAIATAAGIGRDAQRAVLREYRGLPHRCQRVRSLRGVEYYDDSKGTNVAASVAALKGLAASCSGRIVLIAGGLAKESDFSALSDELARCGGAAVLIGAAASAMKQALAPRVPVVQAATMDDAVQAACGIAKHGDIVLLSPACASFDMFRDYHDRGERFTAAVRALPEAEAS
jgi:UDP-N-acetylmuramoylalanine--D-glutamate ligase